MKFHFSLCLSFILLPFLVQAQVNHGNCSSAKAFSNMQLRSNTFTVSQISETEKYDVHFYFLNLNMTNTSTALSGSTEIHSTARENLDSALIELFHTFNISSITVDGNPVGFSRVNSALKIPVNKNQGENFIIKVDYDGTPPTASSNPLGGGGMTNDDSPSWGNWVTWSLSQPFSAYEWFPCKQSLTDKADSSAVWITVPNTCKAGSNGVLENVVDLGNGTQRFEWKHRHKIDYYLISVAVGEYVEYTVTANPINSSPVMIQNFIYNNPSTLPFFQNDIDETADFIELFATQFGPYPFADEKYGHCMAPVGGGMEHQTMTTQGFFNAGLTSHELAHQWFGDHVTCASWADIWVNEGFASYSEYLMLEVLYPGDEVTDMADRHTNIKSSPDGSVWCEDSLNTARIFSGRLTYDKGAAIIHTLRFLIDNDNLFFASLQQYQNVYADSTASGIQFVQEVEDVTGMNFTNFLQEWYFGEGFPTYSVAWNKTGTDMHLQITHTVSQGNVTPTFTNDLELKFSRTSLPDTIIRFSINANTTQTVLNNVGDFTAVTAIDPNNWIINNEGPITNDPGLFASISENSLDDRIHIYPNPASGPIQISMKNDGNYELTIFDQRGRMIARSSFQNATNFDLSTYAEGIYLFQVENEIGETVHKLVKH